MLLVMFAELQKIDKNGPMESTHDIIGKKAEY